MPANSLWSEIKNRGEDIGIVFFLLGIAILITKFVFDILDLAGGSGLLEVALSLIAVGLGSTAIGVSVKSDKKQTEILERLDKNVARLLPTVYEGDRLSPEGQLIAKMIPIEQSKEAAQKRIDEDAAKVGFVRGEVYQTEAGNWAVHWGGKYRL